MNILVADDEPTSRLIAQMALAKPRSRMPHRQRRRPGLEVFQARAPDVVISDWMMPGLTGLELCRNIRAHTPGGYTYFIMVTGQGGAPTRSSKECKPVQTTT